MTTSTVAPESSDQGFSMAHAMRGHRPTNEDLAKAVNIHQHPSATKEPEKKSTNADIHEAQCWFQITHC